jgi:soluble lytic murein transglycosylase
VLCAVEEGILLRSSLAVLLFIVTAAVAADPVAPSAPPPANAPVAATPAASSNLDSSSLQLGIQAYLAGKFDLAEPLLRKAGEKTGVLSNYQQYFLADTLIKLNHQDEAAAILRFLVNQKPPAEIKNKSMYRLGTLAFEKSQWREAKARLQMLVKKWKSAEEYPDMLYLLLRVELKLHNRAQACQYARKLYLKFPAHPLIASWSANMKQVEVDGQKFACPSKMADFHERIRRLNWAGETDRAHKEIEAVKASVSESEKPALDLMLARQLMSEGLVEDSLALLVRGFPKQKSDFNYLTLLGSAAARAGEYQTAVGAYEKAHDLSPHSKRGREALFQAAFLSYQFQDYDGAVRKFGQLVHENPRSGLSRDAQWHLAWLQYLRSDFEGAYKKMADARLAGLHSKKFRGSSTEQRLLYWMAMSLLRQNRTEEAKNSFAGLIQTSPGGYYALAAQARLAQITKEQPSNRVTASAVLVAEAPKAVEAGTDEEDESEDTMTDEKAPEVAGDAEESGSEVEPLEPGDFKEPAARAHLEAAKKLTEFGLTDLAKGELWEVERRTSNPTYLRQLISSYEAIGFYNRSASISELSFAGERHRLGFDVAKALWQSAYPQAFKKSVAKTASAQDIPPEWIWAIMRAESLYKTDVVSPVGAKGLMQLMPFTARNLARLGDNKTFKIEELIDPAVNISLGGQYLSRLGRQFHGSLPLVAAAYNAGPHRVQSWLISFGHLEADEFIEHIPYIETRNYVKKVVLNHSSYRLIYAKEATPLKFLSEPLGVAIPAKAPTHESWDSI